MRLGKRDAKSNASPDTLKRRDDTGECNHLRRTATIQTIDIGGACYSFDLHTCTINVPTLHGTVMTLHSHLASPQVSLRKGLTEG